MEKNNENKQKDVKQSMLGAIAAANTSTFKTYEENVTFTGFRPFIKDGAVDERRCWADTTFVKPGGDKLSLVIWKNALPNGVMPLVKDSLTARVTFRQSEKDGTTYTNVTGVQYDAAQLGGHNTAATFRNAIALG